VVEVAVQIMVVALQMLVRVILVVLVEVLEQ